MLYFLYGEDKNKRNIEKEKILSGSKPNYFNEKSFNQSIIDEYCLSTTMFGGSIYILVDDICETKGGKELFLKNIEKFVNSKNVFLFLENKSTKDINKKIEKFNGKVLEFTGVKEFSKKETPIVFLIADAFCDRNKKLAWMYLLEAFNKNVSSEEICGTLFWAIKNMMIAKDAKNLPDSGLSPYVFNKAKKFSLKFTKEELKKISFNLTSMYHKAHLGQIDFTTALEEFLLRKT